jgi:hypothetical protein
MKSAREQLVQFHLLDARDSRSRVPATGTDRRRSPASSALARGRRRSSRYCRSRSGRASCRYSSTPMKRFFSHLPAWVDGRPAGSWRASANIMAMACSAVVIELPNGRVHHDDAARGGGRDIDIVDADAGAADRPSASWRLLSTLAVTLVAERMARPSYWPMISSSFFLVLARSGLIVDLDAAVLEDLDGGGSSASSEIENRGPWKKSSSCCQNEKEKQAVL